MALDQIPDKRIRQVLVTFSNQSYLLTKQVLSILKDKFGVLIDYLHYITGLHVDVLAQEVEKTHKVADSAGEQAAALLGHSDDLLLGEAILAELAHELLYLVDLAEVEVGEGAEYLGHLFLRYLMVQVEEELNLLNLLVEILSADQLGALKESTHGLLLLNALALHCLKVVSEILLSFAKYIGVPHRQGADRVHLEAFLVHEKTLKSLDASLLVVN